MNACLCSEFGLVQDVQSDIKKPTDLIPKHVFQRNRQHRKKLLRSCHSASNLEIKALNSSTWFLRKKRDFTNQTKTIYTV